MKAHFSFTSKKDGQIIQLKPETSFEREVLSQFGDKGKWEAYHDGDSNLVIYEDERK